MPEFQFIARDANRRQVSGRRGALSSEDLAMQLQGEQLTPIEITKISKSSSKNKTSWKDIEIFKSRVSKEQLEIFCRQMHTVIKAGLPLSIAIGRLAETTQDKELGHALQQILVGLNQGKNLYSAMRQFPLVFSDFFTSLIRVGENTGTLEVVFLHLAEYLELETDTKKKIKTALRYPIMVIVANVIAILVINILVIPAFAELFKSFQGKLPGATVLLINTSNFLIHDWYICIAVCVIVFFSLRFYLKTPSGGINWARLQLKIPVIGWLLQRIMLARFAKLYALVLRAGVPAVEGIDLVSASTGNIFMAEKIKGVGTLVARGTTISNAISQTQLFPPLIVQMIMLGEDTGNIDKLLEDVAEFYQREVDYDLARLSDAIEPIMLIIMGIMVLILALGVFMPMWKIASLAGKG